MAILEKCDPTFRELFYPKELRCPLEEKRIVRAIEEGWPAYFPTQKECRGTNWTWTNVGNKPLYKPHPKSLQKLEHWKKEIAGTIVEGRAYGADVSWKRFFILCRKSPVLRPFVSDFMPLADFLIQEESMWPRYGGVAVGMETFLQDEMAALLAPDSPYRFSDPQRLRFLKSQKTMIEKIQMIDLMRQLFERPLMILALLQKCASKSKNSSCWLNLQDYVTEILKTPNMLTIRRTWLEHAMRTSNSTKKSGKPCLRKWAQRLLAGVEIDPDDVEDDATTTKAIEVNRWMKGKKLPSVENIERLWLAVVAAKKFNQKQAKAGRGRWLLSWMVALLLEKHFTEVAAEFKGERREIQNFYRRFFHYLEIFPLSHNQGADGREARQPCD
jgi:hypothetical protein